MQSNQNTGMAIVAADPAYPGVVLRPGSSGSEVARMQLYLNGLRDAAYPTLIRLTVDGRYGSGTASTVMQYQVLNGLSMDGLIGRNTWDSIVGEYNTLIGGSALRPGSRGEDVRHMQRRLNELARIYTAINPQNADGIYGDHTTNAVRRFQEQFGLSADGILGLNTWNKIVSVYEAVTAGRPTAVVTPYPGNPLRVGSTGDSVRFVQSYLNAIHGTPHLNVDGNYGQATARSVAAFQAISGLTPDGIVGAGTWPALISAFNATL